MSLANYSSKSSISPASPRCPDIPRGNYCLVAPRLSRMPPSCQSRAPLRHRAVCAKMCGVDRPDEAYRNLGIIGGLMVVLKAQRLGLVEVGRARRHHKQRLSRVDAGELRYRGSHPMATADGGEQQGELRCSAIGSRLMRLLCNIASRLEGQC